MAFERKLRLAFESRVDTQTQIEEMEERIDEQIGEEEYNNAEQAAEEREDALSINDETSLPEIETAEETASHTSHSKKSKKKKDKKDKKKEKQEE